MTAQTQFTSTPVRKTIMVKATPERAFDVFTRGIDTWWARDHHIGKSPMKRVVVEGHVGGRCYTEQVDGAECDWGQVLAWDPPHSFTMAWQVSAKWEYEPDLAKSSEVEVRFVAEPGGMTKVELEHRYFERHGAGFENMRGMIDSPMGWMGLLKLYAEKAEQEG
jgi:hypothetical protein